MRESCVTCALRYSLVQFDYTHDSCVHTPLDGYLCMALHDEGKAVRMVGLEPDEGICECYTMKGGKP